MPKGSKPNKKDRSISLEMDTGMLGGRNCHIAAIAGRD